MEPPIDRLLRISNAKANADLKFVIGSRKPAQDLTHKERDPSTGLTIVQSPSGGLVPTRAMHNSLNGNGDPVAMFQPGANGVGTIDGRDTAKKKVVPARQEQTGEIIVVCYTVSGDKIQYYLAGHQRKPVKIREEVVAPVSGRSFRWLSGASTRGDASSSTNATLLSDFANIGLSVSGSRIHVGMYDVYLPSSNIRDYTNEWTVPVITEWISGATRQTPMPVFRGIIDESLDDPYLESCVPTIRYRGFGFWSGVTGVNKSPEVHPLTTEGSAQYYIFDSLYTREKNASTFLMTGEPSSFALNNGILTRRSGTITQHQVRTSPTEWALSTEPDSEYSLEVPILPGSFVLSSNSTGTHLNVYSLLRIRSDRKAGIARSGFFLFFFGEDGIPREVAIGSSVTYSVFDLIGILEMSNWIGNNFYCPSSAISPTAFDEDQMLRFPVFTLDSSFVLSQRIEEKKLFALTTGNQPLSLIGHRGNINNVNFLLAAYPYKR